jgi:chorismate--pyruvate lyase
MRAQYQLKWQKNPNISELPPHLSPWLFYPGSFMQRMREQSVHEPRVVVLRQQWRFPLPDEKSRLNIASRSYALIREVLILSAEKKWMYARTVFPQATLTGKQRCLARLKNRSLGSVLFSDPDTQRSEFEIAKIHPHTAWHDYVAEQAKIKSEELWARCSIFTIQHKALLLTEIFLPDMSLV